MFVVDKVFNVKGNNVVIDDKESPVAVVAIVAVEKAISDSKGKDGVVDEEESEAAAVAAADKVVVVNKVSAVRGYDAVIVKKKSLVLVAVAI